MFNTPILYLIFNRPDLVEVTFSAISSIKPKKLFIAADGPRLDNHLDASKCIVTRQYILSKIDWDCEVQTLFRDENLGCGKAVSYSITWFFSHVDEGIILEDDCCADPSFFTFCEDLLDRFRNNNNIFHINGTNHQFGIKRGFSDYYFSIYPHVWGWATWKRAWDQYDFNMRDFELFKKDKIFKKYAQISLISSVINGDVDTWDIQWVYSVFRNRGLVITPNVNLIKNIGFGENATHTTSKIPKYVKYSMNGSIVSPVSHPILKWRNIFADRFTSVFVHNLIKPNFIDRVLKKIFSIRLFCLCYILLFVIQLF
jgi:hypothetical protein